MDVVGDTRSRCFAQIEPHVEPARDCRPRAEQLRNAARAASVRWRFGRNRSQRGKVLVGHDHHMACGVRISIEAYKAVQAAMDDVNCLFRNLAGHSLSDSVVNGGDHVAEDAVLVLGLGRRPRRKSCRDTGAGFGIFTGNVAVAPGCPEAVHWPSIAATGPTRMSTGN